MSSSIRPFFASVFLSLGVVLAERAAAGERAPATWSQAAGSGVAALPAAS